MKMHTQSDRQLQNAVVEQLEWDPEISSPDISASAKAGAVTLTGFVHSYAEKIAAEKAAKSVYGLKAIANDIQVKPMLRTDPEIARDVVRGISNKIQLKPRVSPIEVKTKIEDALRRNAVVDSGKITVSASEGTITLAGNVRSWFERQVAESAAWVAPGVSCVVDHIVIVP